MDPSHNLTISILIPTRNRAAYIVQTIDSVLAQDYPHLEIIVSDNASTDETPRLLRRYATDARFRYYRNDYDIGLVGNHRKALEHATGDFFLVLSDDDYFVDPRYLTAASSLIQKNPGMVMVYAQGYILNEGTKIMQQLMLPFKEIESGKSVFMSRGRVRPLDFTLCNVLFQTRIARSLNPYVNENNLSSDSELFLKMCLQGSVGVIKDFVSVYRIHPTSITHNIRQDPNLLVHNLDHLLQPYLYAKRLTVLTNQEEDYWKRNVVIPELKMTLLTGILYHRNRFPEIMEAVQQKCPDLYHIGINNTKFKLKLKIAKTSRLLYYVVSGAYRRELARERSRMKTMDTGKRKPERHRGKIVLFRRFRKTLKNLRRVDDIAIMNASLAAELDALRSKLDVSDELIDRFHAERTADAYQSVYSKETPLVSVCVGTYNRGALLVERCVRSILNQTYRNLEVIIVGDCCTDDTEFLMSQIRDTRVRFINLPERGNYPDEAELRWFVAGTSTFNHALSIASGDFITHLDDDDEYTPDRIQKLLAHIREVRADIVFHPFWMQADGDTWGLNKAEGFTKNQVTTSSVLYHQWLKRVTWDMDAYKYREPGDWNRFRKLLYMRARASRFPEPLLKHYRERNQQKNLRRL